MKTVELHPSIETLIRLSARIAAGHPGGDVCLMDRAHELDMNPEHVALAVQIARQVRDDAQQRRTDGMDEAVNGRMQEKLGILPDEVELAGGCCGNNAKGGGCG